jgi:serine/threonine-protein kinase
MATVHLGRLMGPVGFARTVAIKRLHPQFAKDPEFVSMFLDEARLAARIQHPNVCQTLDVVATHGELFLVMELLQGETLSRLVRATARNDERIPPNVVVSIIGGALYGLHAAHEAKTERGEALGIVHRDISPQNILVNRDGVTKVLDFGVAKAAGRFHTTREGNVKGKLPYMSPEQLRNQHVDRQTDIYAASVCLWEALTGRKLFKGDNEGAVLEQVLFGVIEPPSTLAENISPALDALVMRGLERDKTKRFATAKEMAVALERTLHPALPTDVGEWVERIAGESLSQRAERVAEIESVTGEQPALTQIMSGLEASNQDASQGSGPLPSNPEGISSQVSSISVAASDSLAPSDARPRKKRMVLFVTLGAAALLAAVLLGVTLGGGRAPASTGATATATAAAATTPATTPITPSASAAPTAVATTAKTATVPTTKTTAVAKPPPPTGAAPNCNPPFRIGPNGEKIYKRECM